MGAILNSRIVKWVLAPVAIICALVVVFAWGNFQPENPTCTFRYKLTAEVQTPDGVKTGSSVWEVGYASSQSAGGEINAHLSLTGQALYVDLGSGKNLFILLTNRYSGREGQYDDMYGNYDGVKGPLRSFSLPIKMFNLKWTFGKEKQLCDDFVVASATIKPEIPFGNLPTLIAFTDVNVPNTVKVVQPDQFDTDYGSGYQFLSAKIEATTEAPTTGLERILPWLPSKAPKDRSMGGASIFGGAIRTFGPLYERLDYAMFTADHQTAPHGYWP
jgi:hypothetical protein